MRPIPGHSSSAAFTVKSFDPARGFEHPRQGVTFQNSGNLMTSPDVKWSIDRAIGIKGNPSFLLYGITSVDPPDANTVQITKSAPDPAFISKGSFGVFAVLDSKTVQATVEPADPTPKPLTPRCRGSTRTRLARARS